MARRVAYLSFAAGRTFGRTRADVVMTRDLGTAALLVRLPRAGRPPVVYESHGYAPDAAAARPAMLSGAAAPTPARLKRLAAREHAVWRAADGYATITAALAQDLQTRFGPRARVAVVPDGVRITGAFSDEATADPGLVGYAGHLYPWKGVDVLLDALSRLPGVRGIVIGGLDGEPDRARLEARARELGIADRVEFTGQLPPADVPMRLRRAGILVLPNPASAISTRHTSPLKLFEYMALGRAIVASDLPAIREVLVQDTNALLVEPGSAADLAAGIRRLLTEPDTRERLARRARVDALEYTWDKRAERLERLFEAVRPLR